MEQVATPAQQIALWADILRDISARGLHFANNVYDQDNYQKVQDIAIALLALATGDSLEEMEKLRAPIFSRGTPLTVGDAAVMNRAGQILLIRRADNGLWAMPGGALEIGETPAEGIVREAFEETGIRCRATTLAGVFDSRFHSVASRHHLIQIVYLCEPLDEAPTEPSHAHEVTDIQWFAEDALPADLDPNHRTRIPHAFRVWHGDVRAYFDS